MQLIQKPLIVGMVAGEKSGDILGSGLISALKGMYSNITFVGIAGSLMQRNGCNSWYNMDELSLLGIFEIITHLPRLLRIRSELFKRFIATKINIFIGIDAPEFNIELEYRLKSKGIKTIHYVSPSIWAWRSNRIFKIKNATNLVLLLWPFEKKIYQKYNVKHSYIGHNMADKFLLFPNKKKSRKLLKINYNVICLSILPGSRLSEINMLTIIFLRTAQILIDDFPRLKILVPIINKTLRNRFESIYKNNFPELSLDILDGMYANHAMIASDITLLASGTATLECMLAKCPMVVGYKMNKFTFWLLEKIANISFISLPNLLANTELVKEYIQTRCQPQLLANALKFLLINKMKVKYLKKEFTKLHKIIRCNADKKAAKEILKLIKY